jgi:hypothetical protein
MVAVCVEVWALTRDPAGPVRVPVTAFTPAVGRRLGFDVGCPGHGTNADGVVWPPPPAPVRAEELVTIHWWATDRRTGTETAPDQLALTTDGALNADGVPGSARVAGGALLPSPADSVAPPPPTAVTPTARISPLFAASDAPASC